MARSSEKDITDKFRFIVLVIEDLLGNNVGSDDTITCGFSQITIPEASVTTITYRENLHAQRFIKKPGLVKYTPLVLQKGSTKSRQLYNWFTLVNNDAIGYGVAAQINGALQIPPVYPAKFRKDLLVSSLDRAGNAVKSWVFLDAFPVGYKGANDFDANANEKLIEQLSIEFEAMVEIVGNDLQSLADEAFTAAQKASVAAAANFILSGGSSGGGIF
jgi:phage tail-like protein